jgi:G3E family GTPase
LQQSLSKLEDRDDPLVLQTQEKTSVLLLSGFLGAGKTTLLKRILSWETDLSETVVMVNEFGDIGIDGTLLKDSGSDVIELTSGCICCTLSADLRKSLKSIWQRFNPRRIFIESSGVADPKSIESVIVESDLSQFMALSKIITVLEADLWEAREVFGPLFYNQLEMAHLILLNKIDLLDKDKIPQYLKEIHEVIPDCQVVPTIHCGVDPETLWATVKSKDFGLKPMDFYQPELLKNDSRSAADHSTEHSNHVHGHSHPKHEPDQTINYVTFSFQNPQPMDENCFKTFIDGLPWEMFRIKGPVRFENRVVMLNFVGGKDEWSDWEGEPETRLAFIGWGVSEEEILRKLKDCIINS